MSEVSSAAVAAVLLESHLAQSDTDRSVYQCPLDPTGPLACAPSSRPLLCAGELHPDGWDMRQASLTAD